MNLQYRLFFKILFCVFSFAVFAEEADSVKPPAPENKTALQGMGPLKRDTEYHQLPVSENLHLIYSEDFKNYSSVFSDYVRQVDHGMSQIFPVSSRMKQFVFFPSSRRQVSNAYASVYPFSFVAIYPSSSTDFLDRWSIFHWTQDVLVHEMTHIHQISQNKTWDKRLRLILGPLSYRNMLLGSFALEGHAVLTESIYGHGGRLFSGWVRAFVFSQIKHGLSLKRILKSYDDPFVNLEKYLHGGYFFAYLHSKYGEKKVYQMFSESGRSLSIGFYALNRTMRKTFGRGLESLFKGYKDYYLSIAEKQQSSPEPVILKSKTDLPMNSDGNTIYFLASDSKSPPQLVLFDKETGQIKKETVNLPLGKIFYREGGYYSSASSWTRSTAREYSLFGEGFKPLEKYNSQLVMDFYGDQYVSLDTRESHSQNFMLKNNEPFDVIHSSAIMDHRGRVYYFKQNGSVRTLYRDKKPLAKISSYYAYPVEADEEGLYFISSTQYGSSLFVYKESAGIFRLSLSDTITNARKIKENRFLVSEVGPTHQEYKVISVNAFSANPVLYKYSFKKKNAFNKSSEALALADSNSNPERNKESPAGSKDMEKAPDKESDSSNLESSLLELKELTESSSSKAHESSAPLSKNYSSLGNLSLRQMMLSFSVDSFFTSQFQFLDPLQYSQLDFSNVIGPDQKRFDLSYTYQRYRPSLSFSLSYDESFLRGHEDRRRIHTLKNVGFLETDDIYVSSTENSLLKKRDRIPYRDRAFSLSFEYPFFKRAQWKLSAVQSLQFGQMQFRNTDLYFGERFPLLFYQPKPWKNYVQNVGQLKYSYKRKYFYSYSFYSQRFLQLSYRILSLGSLSQPDHFRLSAGLRAYIMEELGREWFFSLDGIVKKKLWDREPQSLFSRPGSVGFGSFKQVFQDLYQLNFQVLKVLNHSFYPLSFLFSMRRWAPLAGVSVLSVKPFRRAHELYLVPFIGAEWELALFYEEMFFKTGLAGEYVFNLSQRPSFQMSFWLKGNF